MQTIQLSDAREHKAKRHPRVRISTPFSCILASLETRWWFRRPISAVGLVYDLSPHGVCVSTEVLIRTGEQIALTLRLTKAAPPAEVAVATVCWMNYPFYGFAFRRISESSLKQLTEYMNAVGSAKERGMWKI